MSYLIDVYSDPSDLSGMTRLFERSDEFGLELRVAVQLGKLRIARFGGKVAKEVHEVVKDSYDAPRMAEEICTLIANQEPPIQLPESFYFYQGVLEAMKEERGVSHV